MVPNKRQERFEE